MKTKRFAKLAVLALTAVLLIGAAIGFSASASDETTVAIAGKNLSYEGAVQLVYYVDAQNYDSAAQTLKMDFWVGEKTETPSYTNTFAGSNYIVEKDGKTYYAFFSNGIAPKDMTVPVYAQPFVVDASGDEVARGEVVEYGVYTYAMNRFSQSPTDDQITLYTALLDYGAAVQEVFDNANVDAYGWADAYYQITENVYVDGVLDADKSLAPAAAQRPSELSDKIVDGSYVLAYAGERYGDAIYKNITDATYSIKYDTYATPGVHTYNINYTTEGTLYDFEGLTDVNVLFEDGDYDKKGHYENGNLYIDSTILDAINRKDQVKYMLFETGTGMDGNESNYIVTGTVAAGGGWKIDINDGTNILDPTVGVTYVVDFDFKINALEYTGACDTMVYMGLNSTVYGFTASTGNSAYNFIPFRLYANGSVEPEVLNIQDQSALAIDRNEWVDIRVEYEVISAERAILRYYINGVFCYTEATSTIATPETFYVEMRSKDGAIESQEYYFDNIYIGAYKAENTKGTGIYYNGLETTDYSISYNFDDVTNIGTLLSKYTGTTLNNTSANHYTAVVDGELVTGTSDVVTDTSVGAGSWGWFAMKGPDNTNNDGEVGTKYVLEMDFKYNGGTGRTSDQRIAYSFGMNSLAQPASSGTSFAAYTLYDDGNNNLNFGSASSPAFQLKSGIWYNVRFEYVVTANGYKVNGSTVWAGTLNAYVDGDLVATKACSSTTSDINMAFESFYFEHNGVSSEYVMDNIYMGIVNDSVNKGTGVYYNKYLNGELADPTIYDFSDDTSLGWGDEFVNYSTAGYGNNFTLNNKVTTDADGDGKVDSTGSYIYDTRYAVATGSGAMQVGSYAWEGKGLLNANSIALEVGETAVIESDIQFLGSDAQSSYFMYFQVWNGSYANLGTIYLRPGSPADGTSYNFYTNDNAHPVQANEWHNMRIEITRTESGATLAYYLDDAQVATSTTTTDASVISGLMMITRPSGATRLSFLYDNIVFANASKEPEADAVTYDSYYEAYQAGATEHNGNTFSSNVYVQNFDDITTVAKGTGELLASTTTASLNTSNPSETPSSATPYVNVSGGALNFGYDGPYGTTNYGVDINIGQTAAVGQTYVIEYDFTFNGSVWNTSGSSHLILSASAYTNATTSGMGTMANWQGNRVNSDSNGTGESLTLAVPAYVSEQFTAGTTYKIRIEIEVTGEQTCTVNYYIDGVSICDAQSKTNTTDTDTRNYLTLNILRFQVYNVAVSDYTIDNLIVAVVEPTAAE